MSVVTLYKKCVLQKDYKEVLHPDVLSSYLSSLDSTIVDTGNRTLFMRFNDSIYLSLDKIGYNYMKVENTNFTFYAFIEDMVIHNETIDVYYSLDVWNTFFKKTQIRNGLLTRTLWFNKNHEHYLPLEYEGNDALIPSVHNASSLLLNDKYGTLLYTIQYYTLSSAGEISERKLATMVHVEASEENVIVLNYVRPYKILDTLIANQATQSFSYNGQNYYYDIIDIHVIPKTWAIKINTTINNNLSVAITEVAEISSFEFCIISNIPSFTTQQEIYGGAIEYELFEGTINQTGTNLTYYKKKFIGPLDKLNEVKTNGLSTTYKYIMVYSGTLFHFFLKFNNQIVEVSDSLRLNIPYTSVTGETASLRELSAEMSYTQGKAQSLSALYNVGAGLVSGAIGVAMKNAMVIQQPITSLGENVSDVVLGNLKSEQAYAEKYSTMSPSADLKSNAFFTAQYINEPVEISTNNEEEVKSAIVEQGFKVRYLIQGLPSKTDTDLTLYKSDYNVVKYGSLSLIGEAPHNYLERIKRILESGTRIWYTIPYAIEP